MANRKPLVIINGALQEVPASDSLISTGGINNTPVGNVTPSTVAATTVSASGQITSTVTNGTAPMVIGSTTKVTNLNADLLEGMHASTTNVASTVVARDANGVINTTGVQLDTTYAGASAIGLISWDLDAGTARVGLAGGNAVLQIGQEEVTPVYNNTASAMVDMQVVRVTGSQGNNLTVALAQANSEANSANSLAVVTEPIAVGAVGFATRGGLIHNVDTSAYTEGAALWLSPTVAGGITTTKPTAPNHLVLIGWVVRSHASVGMIFVHIQNGYELEELHDVLLTGKANNDSLWYNSAVGVWENRTPANARSSLGLVIGTDVQAWDADLDAISALTATTGVLKKTAANTWVLDTGVGTGTVSSVGMTTPTGLTVSGSPITTSGTLALSLTAGYSIPTTSSQTNWDSAYTQRWQWDGGATNLVAATGRSSLGGTTVGQNFFTLTNPSAITFPRVNVDNTVSMLDAATFRTAIGAGTGTVTSVSGTAPIASSGGATPTISIPAASSTTDGYLSAIDWNTFNSKGSGTVTSVGMTVPTGLTVSGTPITSAGTLALTLTAGYSIPTTSSQTNWDSAYTQRLQWDGGATNLVAATGRTSLGLGTAAVMTGPSGTIVGTTDTQTLTNKTVEAATFTNGYTEEVAVANTNSAYTIDLANGSIQKLTLTGNCTYTFPTATLGKSFVLYQLQDATGSRTVTWPASVKWPSGTAPTLTSTANKADIFAFTADGTNWLGRTIGQAYL